MADARLEGRIARFLNPDAICDDADESTVESRRKAARRIIAIVRRSDRRRNPPIECDFCGKPADARPAYCNEHSR